MKNLIIGGATNYTWDHLKYWVNSIKASGFEGDIALVTDNIGTDTLNKLESEGVRTVPYRAEIRGAPHVQRFINLWDTLQHNEDYNWVITTDTRDVIFQEDPWNWIGSLPKNKKLIFSSEGLAYKEEPWGYQNIHQTFGKTIASTIEDRLIYNVGVIAGKLDYVKELLLNVYQLSLGRPIPIVDQAVFNYLIGQEVYQDCSYYATNKDMWAIQLGTTEEAVKAGSGDIGIICKQNPNAFDLYKKTYRDDQPAFTMDGVVTNHGMPFTIVHQYDRIPGLKEKIMKRYG